MLPVPFPYMYIYVHIYKYVSHKLDHIILNNFIIHDSIILFVGLPHSFKYLQNIPQNEYTMTDRLALFDGHLFPVFHSNGCTII